jgi:hypothetical protein
MLGARETWQPKQIVSALLAGTQCLVLSMRVLRSVRCFPK